MDCSNSVENASTSMKSGCADLLERALRRKKVSSWKVFEMRMLLLDRGLSDKGKRAVLIERYGVTVAYLCFWLLVELSTGRRLHCHRLC